MCSTCNSWLITSVYGFFISLFYDIVLFKSTENIKTLKRKKNGNLTGGWGWSNTKLSFKWKVLLTGDRLKAEGDCAPACIFYLNLHRKSAWDDLKFCWMVTKDLGALTGLLIVDWHTLGTNVLALGDLGSNIRL